MSSKDATKEAPLLRRLRIALAFICFLALCASFLDFRHALPAFALHVLPSFQILPALLRGLAGGGLLIFGGWILVTWLFGRVYCSTVCPLGVWQDLVWRLRQTIRPKRLRFAKAKSLPRVAVLGLATVATFGLFSPLLVFLDPWGLFGRMATNLGQPLAILANNAAVPLLERIGFHGLYWVKLPPLASTAFASLAFAAAFLLGITWLAAWRGRIYCNVFCPVGTCLGAVARVGVLRLAVDKNLCEKCGECLKVCKAQCIDLKAQKIDASRCVNCFNCVSTCERGGIRYARFAPFAKGTTSSSGRTDAKKVADPARREVLGKILPTLGLGIVTGTILSREGRADPKPSHPEAKGRKGESKTTNEATEPLQALEVRRAIAPPGAGRVDRYLAKCTACGLCVSVCPTRTLQAAFLEWGWKGALKPRLDPESGFCNFTCARCTEVCPTGALTSLPLPIKKRTRLGVAHFDSSRCIVQTDGTDCAACSEHCPTKAVDTVSFRGDKLIPKVDEALCIGCGACEAACPVRPIRAIRVSGKDEHVLLAASERPPKPKAAPAVAPVETRTVKPPVEDFPF